MLAPPTRSGKWGMRWYWPNCGPKKLHIVRLALGDVPLVGYFAGGKIVYGVCMARQCSQAKTTKQKAAKRGKPLLDSTVARQKNE